MNVEKGGNLVVRDLAVEFGNLSKLDGSAILSQGNSVVQAAVFGPAAVRHIKEQTGKATIEVIFKPKVGVAGCCEKLKEQLIRSTMEMAILGTLHPRTSITIILHEMQNSGSLLACSINAACMAIIDSGLPMRCLVAAVGAVISQDDEILLDPSAEQEKDVKASFTFVFENTQNKMVTTTSSGTFTDAQFHSCQQACQQAAGKLFSFYRESVHKRYSKDQLASKDDG